MLEVCILWVWLFYFWYVSMRVWTWQRSGEITQTYWMMRYQICCQAFFWEGTVIMGQKHNAVLHECHRSSLLKVMQCIFINQEFHSSCDDSAKLIPSSIYDKLKEMFLIHSVHIADVCLMFEKHCSSFFALLLLSLYFVITSSAHCFSA